MELDGGARLTLAAASSLSLKSFSLNGTVSKYVPDLGSGTFRRRAAGFFPPSSARRRACSRDRFPLAGCAWSCQCSLSDRSSPRLMSISKEMP